MNTPPYPKFSSWLWATLGSALVGGLGVFYGLFHLVLEVPLSKLKIPFVLVSILTVFLSPFLYQARKHQAQSGGRDVRLYFLIAGPYVLLVLLIYVFFGIRLGVLSPDHAVEYYTLVILSAILGSAVGYYLHRILFRPPPSA